MFLCSLLSKDQRGVSCISQSTNRQSNRYCLQNKHTRTSSISSPLSIFGGSEVRRRGEWSGRTCLKSWITITFFHWVFFTFIHCIPSFNITALHCTKQPPQLNKLPPDGILQEAETEKRGGGSLTPATPTSRSVEKLAHVDWQWVLKPSRPARDSAKTFFFFYGCDSLEQQAGWFGWIKREPEEQQEGSFDELKGRFLSTVTHLWLGILISLTFNKMVCRKSLFQRAEFSCLR